ncbi:MAG: stalk domain-containing protein [Candidatus Ornithomonoglobus sp.]
MKKILCLLAALSISTAYGFNAIAADKEKGEPDVIVDSSKILFDDQNAKIVDDVTLVPARGVFEAMGCKVDWNGEDRTVTVTSSTGVRYVVITIDSDVMKISTFKTLMKREDKDYTLEVPAQIINDRTMIPLRAVSEAFDCDVKWDDDSYAVSITTGDPILLEGFTYTAPVEDDMVKMSLSTDHEGLLTEGEEFTVYVNVENMPAKSCLSGIAAAFEYDKTRFEYVEGSGTLLNNNGEEIPASAAGENIELSIGARILFVNIDETTANTVGKYVFKATFKSVSGERGTIVLNNDYVPMFGYGSYLMFTDDKADTVYNGKNIIIDSTPLVIGE